MWRVLRPITRSDEGPGQSSGRGRLRRLGRQNVETCPPPEGSLAAAGLDEFNGICSTCHVIDGVNQLDDPVGPNLTHFADPYRNVFAGASLDRTDEHLAEWLADPPTIKPGSFMPDLNLTADEIDSLVEYLQGLDPTKEN